MGVKILVYIGHRFLEKPYQWASITILKTPFEHNCYFIFLKNHSFSAAMTLRLLLNVCSEKQMLKCWTPNDVWMWATWIEFLHFPKFKGDTSQCPLCKDTTGGHYLWPWKQALGRPSNPVHRCSDLGLHFSSLPTTHISAAYFLLGQNSQEKKINTGILCKSIPWTPLLFESYHCESIISFRQQSKQAAQCPGSKSWALISNA